MRFSITIAAVCLSLVGICAAEPSSASMKKHTEIPAQALGSALQALAKQRDFQIVCRADLVADMQAHAVIGELTAQEALTQLLSGTDLTFRYLDEDTVTIVPMATTPANVETNERAVSSMTPVGATPVGAAPGGFWNRFRLALADQTTDAAGSNAESSGLEEIVVTAQKRAERIQDVPMSISAISGDAIDTRNLIDMNDFLRTLPGVNFIDFGGGRNTIIVRGLSADPQQETKVVGTYFGETPITGLGSNAGGAGGSTNMKMVDIERVELLRGPQGTLYGSGSLGGTLRIIPNRPNLESLGGDVKVGFSDTGGRGGRNDFQKGVLNLPIVSGVLAIRAVGYNFDDTGYVDNIAASDPAKIAAAEATGAVLVDERHMGSTDTMGARVSALWQPTQDLAILLSHAYQDTEVDGRPEVNLLLDDYQQTRFQASGFGGERVDDRFTLTNADINYELGWGSVRSSTSWVEQKSFTVRNFLGPFFDVTPVGHLVPQRAKTFSEELRFVSDFEGPWHLVGGVFYQDLDSRVDNLLYWFGAPELNPFDTEATQDLGYQLAYNKVKQEAVFGEVGYDLLENLSLTVGARYFDYKVRSGVDYSEEGAFSAGILDTNQRFKENGTNLKANVTYRATDDAMLYAQWAQGFRLGMTTNPFPATCDQDGNGIHDELGLRNSDSVKSDSIDSYELGTKITALGNRLALSAAVYHNDWTGIPVYLGAQAECGFGLFVNAGSARTDGAEVEGSYLIVPALRADFSASYVKAELASAVPGLGEEGSRLPGSPKMTAGVGLQYDYPIAAHAGYTRVDYTYVSGFYSRIGSDGIEGGDYHQLNLKSSIDFDRFRVSVFVNNLANTKALAWVDVFEPNGVQLRPRTVGVNLACAF